MNDQLVCYRVNLYAAWDCKNDDMHAYNNKKILMLKYVRTIFNTSHYFSMGIGILDLHLSTMPTLLCMLPYMWFKSKPLIHLEIRAVISLQM